MLKREAEKRLKELNLRFSELYVEKRAKVRNYITFRIDNGVDFATLQGLAKAFNSKSINLNGEHEDGCPTCGGTSYVEITIYDPE